MGFWVGFVVGYFYKECVLFFGVDEDKFGGEYGVWCLGVEFVGGDVIVGFVVVFRVDIEVCDLRCVLELVVFWVNGCWFYFVYIIFRGVCRDRVNIVDFEISLVVGLIIEVIFDVLVVIYVFYGV